MASLTQVYVDPSINGNSGAGTIGNPYGDLQYGLNTQSRDSTNGDQFNIKAGTAEVLTAALSLVSYGSPTASAPLVFRGYTSAANDGGIGEISGGGSFGMLASTSYQNTAWVDLKCHNCGSAVIFRIGDNAVIVNCELANTSGAAVDTASEFDVYVMGCHVHDIGGHGVNAARSTFLWASYLKNETKDLTSVIHPLSDCIGAVQCIYSADGSSNGIRLRREYNFGFGNTIRSVNGTGNGFLEDSDRVGYNAFDNIISGFSGSGGYGIADESAAEGFYLYGFNYVYNCTNDYQNAADYMYKSDNESSGNNPLAESGADSYANRGTYFEPEDVGNVRGGAYGGFGWDKGAVQHEVAAVGGGVVPVFMHSYRQRRVQNAVA